MSDSNRKYNNMERQKGDPLDHFTGGKVEWSRSASDIWADIESDISGKKIHRHTYRRPMRWQMSAAAAILVLFSITTVMRFYSRTIISGAGELSEIVLPDGSSITLNSRSTVSYHPMWWYIERSVSLEGEAWFQVAEGGDFKVISEDFITAVTGTSFNIFSREDEYEVACAEGSVMVSSLLSGIETVLVAGEKVIATREGDFLREVDEGAAESSSWMRGVFYFTSAALADVFREIENQYGVVIEVDHVIAGDEEVTFTGYFPKSNRIEDVLELVCIPFGIKFEQSGEGVYRIIPDETQE
ncbi:MAG: FecR domain-containing protein [Bacteroidales bacterium]|nr:FecR domain-containing protein [Bacteroidales bacterium]